MKETLEKCEVGDVTNTILEDQIAAFANNPGQMFPAAIVAIFVGYWYYVYAVRILSREGKSPVPIWLHCFFLADDSTAAVVFFKAARENDWFWFYVMFSAGMVIWVAFEIYCIWWGLKHERQESFGRHDGTPITMKQSVGVAVALFLVSLATVNLIRVWTGDDVMMQLFTICNILAVVVPPLYWAKNETREGASMGMAVTMVLIAATNFLPPGLGWWTTASSYFDHPLWYIAGAVITLYSVGALIMLSRKPAKVAVAGQRKPIW
jgi:hypothetical protein